MTPTRRQFLALGGTSLATTALSACRSLSPRPFFSTNASDMDPETLDSKDFRSRIPTIDFGRSGKRIVSQIGKYDKVVDLKGNPIDQDEVLRVWTLTEGEYGYKIDTLEQTVTLERPDGAVRLFRKQGEGDLKVNRTYVEKDIPASQRRFVKSHPEFCLPFYEANVGDTPMNLFYATVVQNGRDTLAIVPNAHQFWLYDGDVTIRGTAYTEMLGKVIHGTKPIQEVPCNNKAIVTGELRLLNPITGKSANPETSELYDAPGK